MDELTLVIGNKNYSSWSLRPWLVMRHFNIPFIETRIPLYRDDTAEKLAKWSPSGLVPALKHGDATVWDSLAICEYLHELYPGYSLWPQDRQMRAVARSVSAEMHSGFRALRRSMPMNCTRFFRGKGLNPESSTDIRRIAAIWRECRDKYGGSGTMLFGGFSIADAMFAPVVLRFRAYEVNLDMVCKSYADSVLALPEMQEWISSAQGEKEVIAKYEPGETGNN